MIEKWLSENPTLDEMQAVLERIVARTDHDEVRNHNAVDLHAHLTDKFDANPTPADRKRLIRMMGELLTKVFAITLPPDSEDSDD